MAIDSATALESPTTLEASAVRSGWNLRSLVAVAGLGAIVAGVTLVVLVAATRSTFLVTPSRHGTYPHWMAGPFQGWLRAFHPTRHQLRIEFTAMAGALYLAYLVVLASVSAVPARVLVAAIGGLHLVLFLSPPLSLTDVFNYLHYGRMGALHGLNPYAVLPVHAPHSDPAYHLSNWHHLLSPYGQLFTLVTYALAPLGVATGFWVLKLLLAIASLTTIAIVWRCARLLGRDPRLPVAILALNPVVLIWGLGGDHSDGLMVLALTAALMAVIVRREAAAGAAAVVAIGFKASAIVVAPVLLAAAARKWRAIAGAAAAAIVIAAASYAAFGMHFPNVGTQSKLVAAVSIPNLLGLALGLGGETSALRAALTVALLVGVVAATMQSWRGRELPTVAGWATLGSLVVLAWVLPWYLLLVLPFAALSRSRALRAATILMGVWLILAWMPLMPGLVHSLGLKPSATKVGHQNKRFIIRLLR